MTRWNRFATLAASLAVSLAVSLAAGPALAQLQVERSPATAPVLGTTIRGASTTVFSVSDQGVVTRVSGDAIRLSTGSVRAPTVTIGCGYSSLLYLCALRYIRVTITPAPGSGPATITRFRVGALSGGRFRGGSAPAEGATVTFDIEPLGLFREAAFTLGMDVRLAGGAAGGQHEFDYLVTAQLL